jgi:general secretion pathway protein M
MSALWQGLSPRERALIMAAAGALALMLLTLVLAPRLKAGRAEAKAELQQAVMLNEWVSAQTAQPGRVPAATNVPIEDVRTRLLDAAARRGLAVSRLQATEEANLVFQFEAAPSQTLFGWLAEAEDGLGLAPLRATIDAEDDGRVRASVTFAGTAP